MGRSIRMLAAEATDRDLKTFPRAAFERLPPDDPPALRVIGGVKEPGWFRFLHTEDQWHGPLYKINTALKCYDFVHRLSSKTPAALRLLHLSHIEYLKFALCIASGEYVPVEVIDEHELLRTRAVRWKCVTCNKEPEGDHHAHSSHTQDRRFSARANNICDKDLAHVVDQVEVHLQQLQDSIDRCFSEDPGDPRDSMTRFADLKVQALQTWE